MGRASQNANTAACRSPAHWNRRTLLQASAGALLSGWTPIAESLSRAAEKSRRPRSLILLWLAGGPSQLETFDPKPGTEIAAETGAISTAVKGIQLAKGYERLADRMQHVALVRSVVSKEGDHERATYNGKTGFRPDPTLVHPSIGAVICHQLPSNIEIPRHVSILPGQWPARGGYLGDQFDAFKINDPQGPIPDAERRVGAPRFDRRVNDLQVVETEFARGRLRRLDETRTLHRGATQSALRMMNSDQLRAFDVERASLEVRRAFGATPFGRGCLAAARLVHAGVRCVEVTLPGWDTHINNHESHRSLAETLDPALAALLDYLARNDQLDDTLVVCGGEFGRTPRMNPAGGRDHWPHGFTIALAGGGVPGGRVVGETSPDPPPNQEARDVSRHVRDPHNIADVHATILHLLGIDFEQELQTPVGRPMAISHGKIIPALLPA